MLADTRYTLRVLRKSPGFTLIVVLALALGIGANTAIFSVVNAVLLRALPFPDSGRIVMVWSPNPIIIAGVDELPPSNADLKDWREQNHVFERLAGVTSRQFNLAGEGEPERAGGAEVTGDFFPALGVQPERGRWFTADEDQPGKRVAVISHALWQRRYASDQRIIGRQITIDGQSYSVIGIMPAGFQFPRGSELPNFYAFAAQTDVWTPLGWDARRWSNRGSHILIAIARLRAGVSVQQAQSEMAAIEKRNAEQYGDSRGWSAKVMPLRDQIVGGTRVALWTLLGAVGFVLLIACANVANIVLARASARQKEMAIRTAVGASRMRVVRQLLTESMLLGVAGGALGLVLASVGIDVLLSITPADIPRMEGLGIDGRVLAFTALISVVTGLLFGVAPALQMSGSRLNETLKESGRGSSATAASRRFRGALVVGEVALALVLLAGAGLLMKSFLRLAQVDPGFHAHSALTMDITLPGFKYPSDQKKAAFFQQVLNRVTALPGVEIVGAISRLPLGNSAEEMDAFTIEGKALPANGQLPLAEYRVCSADYFRALGVPLIRGRWFANGDAESRPRVAVINEELAHQYFSGDDPMGKRLKMGFPGSTNPWLTIVGMVHDVRHNSLAAPVPPQLYVSYLQGPDTQMTLVIRTAGDPLQVVAAARNEIRSVDPDQPVANIRTMEKIIAASMARQRFNMLLVGIFAAVALALAAVGLYGVISYSVGQRAHEIGIRMALGAKRSDVLRMVLRQGLVLVAVGLAVGLAAALMMSRMLATLLFEVRANDPMVLAGVALLLGIVAATACTVPALKATRVDPLTALRYE
ncbi:MAG: ABC transporter permease [Acidobacteriia bacterium]|nr:ABC transporter permease [Terriglobia bacterium]